MDTLLSPRRRQLLQGLGAAALVTGCGNGSPGPRDTAAALGFGGETMGSTYTVKIAGRGLSDAAQAAARRAVDGALAGVVDRMSHYRDDSELSRLNRHVRTAPFALSEDTFSVFALARDVSEATGGAFDVTVAPMVDAWGFGRDKTQHVVAEALRRVREARVGWRMLALDPRGMTITKESPDLRADLSGIAKGHGVDLAARALDELGIGDYMVETGGEVRTRGLNAAGRPWQIAVERPDAVPRRAHRIVPMSGLAMATSGDYRIYFERGGTRYCHEIDPATGAPIRHGLASVSVVDASCARADAMATALIVLGSERGYALAVERGVAAYFIRREGEGTFRDFATPAFAVLGASAVSG
ncbi:MAG: FAD:protein FMN transferase [Burkholderiales bacterium]|nr:FAD:protein FMN transferase [Burkholderiales bacterium]